MAGYINFIAIGNVGKLRDDAMAYTQSGVARFNFSVAVTRKYTDSTGEQKESTTWVACTAWRALAETCNTYVKTGMQIMVSGRPSVRAYAGPDGGPRASLDLDVYEVQFLGQRGDSADAAGRESSDLPF